MCTTSIRPAQDDIAEIEIEINRIKEQQNREQIYLKTTGTNRRAAEFRKEARGTVSDI